MRSLHLFLALLLLCGTTASASDLQYTGERPSNAAAIARAATGAVADALLVDSIRVLLENDGYLDSRIEIDGSLVRIEAGPRAQLDRVVDTAGNVLVDRVNRPFTAEAVRQALEQLLLPYRNDGYYFATIEIRRVMDDDSRISLVVETVSGPIMTVSSVSFVGLERTRPDRLRRFLSIDSCDTLSARRLGLWDAEASRLDFVEFIPPISIIPRPGYTGADITFQFVEKESARIEGAMGYLPDDPSGLVWNLNLSLLNLFGGGRRASLRSERRERGRNLFEVAYRQPLFLFGAGSIGGSVATRDYRDAFYEFGVDLSAETQAAESFRIGAQAGWKTVEPSNSLTGYRRFLAGFSIARDNVDDPLNPRSGLSLAWKGSYAYRRYDSDTLSVVPEQTALNDVRTAVRIDWYQPIAGGLVGHAAVRYDGLETSEQLPPLSELVLIGGPGSIRGYRNEQFAAVRAATGTIEPRLRFRAGFAFVFYDAAYTNNRERSGSGIATVERYIQGYGFGVSLTGEGRRGSRSVTLSLGWGEESTFDQPRLSIDLSAGL